MKVTKEFLVLRHASYPERFLAATVDQMDAHLQDWGGHGIRTN